MHCKLNTLSIPSLCIALNIDGGKAQKLTGQFPLSPWAMSTKSMGNVHGLSGHCPWTLSSTPAGQCPWKMSTETMDILQTG